MAARSAVHALFGVLVIVVASAVDPAWAQSTKVCDPEPTDMTLTYKDPTINCAIDAIADVDLFRFQASAGDSVRIVLSETGLFAEPCFEVRDPTNAVVVPTQCDFSSTQTDFDVVTSGRHTIIVSESGNDEGATYDLTLLCLAGPCSDPGPNPGLSLDHYKCYAASVTRGAPRFIPRDVPLIDELESKDTTVLKPVSVCVPVDKNGEGVGNPDDYLVCYDIRDVRGQARFQKLDIEASNQFDEGPEAQRLTVTRSDILCVPSSAVVLPRPE
jgi:hypothetical protein